MNIWEKLKESTTRKERLQKVVAIRILWKKLLEDLYRTACTIAFIAILFTPIIGGSYLGARYLIEPFWGPTMPKGSAMMYAIFFGGVAGLCVEVGVFGLLVRYTEPSESNQEKQTQSDTGG